MSTVEPIRLISPAHRRIFQPDLDGESAAEIQAKLEAAKVTAKALTRAGWRVYRGPARHDHHGWIIPGSDPQLRPLDPFTVYGVRSSVRLLP